jgi:hypothetical protein
LGFVGGVNVAMGRFPLSGPNGEDRLCLTQKEAQIPPVFAEASGGSQQREWALKS